MDASSFVEVEVLSWKRIFPWVTSVILADVAHPHYLLFQEVIEIVKLALPRSALSLPRLHSFEKKALWSFEPAFSTLINLLTDRYPHPRNVEGDFAVEMSPKSTLDFLIIGMLSLLDVKKSSGLEVCHATPIVLNAPSRGQTVNDRDLYLAILLDLLLPHWIDESQKKVLALWCPMPWSRASKQEHSTANSSFLPSFRVPDVADLDGMDDSTATFRFYKSANGCPLDIPWYGAAHDGFPLSMSQSQYVKLRRSESLPSLHDDVSLWMAAMTFGLLEAVLGVHIPENLLLVRGPEPDEKMHISGERILRLLIYWSLNVRWPSSDAHVARGREVVRILDRALMAMDEEGKFGFSVFLRAGYSLDEHVEATGPAALSAFVLCGYMCFVWDELPEMRELVARRRNPTRNAHNRAVDICERTMWRAGWCPYSASSLFMSTINDLATISNVAQLPPFIRNSRDEHKECTQDGCMFYTIDDPDTYVTRHTDPSCNCTSVIPPMKQIERLLETAGDEAAVPVIWFDGEDLHVRAATDGPYVAISHVWADGMGSTAEAGLPKCQIKRIVGLVNDLVPETGAFWIDSLCVPEVKHLRKRAIRFMAKTYQNAAVVLVIDACIRKRCSQSQRWQENLFYIATSGWSRRMWTLQEGVLANKLYFEFADGPVDVPDKIGDFARETENKTTYRLGDLSESFELLDPSQYRSYMPLLATRVANMGTRAHQYSLDDVIRLLASRRTSKPEDETVTVSGLLPSIDVDALLAITGPGAAEERMREFLTQVAYVPKRFPVRYMCERLHLPGFRWAPASLAQAEASSFYGTGLCTREGLFAEYHVATFESPVPIPPDCRDRSADMFSIAIAHPASPYVHRAEMPTYAIPEDITSVHGVLLLQEKLPTERNITLECALVAKNTISTNGSVDEVEASDDVSRYRFVGPCRLEQLPYLLDEIPPATLRLIDGYNSQVFKLNNPVETDILLT